MEMAETKIHDKNIIAAQNFNKEDLVFYDARDERFSLLGVMYDDEKYLRMPRSVAEGVGEGVKSLSQHTSGGRICFKTDSPYLVISCKCYFFWEATTMTCAGVHGFDVYEHKDGRQEFIGLLRPAYDKRDGYTAILNFKEQRERELIVYFPVYTGVSELQIGLSDSAQIKPFGGYTYKTPIVFYGSSITQGYAASIPSNTYVNMLSRHFDSDFINLGMAGYCKAEREMMEYISTLDMSMLVYDYDHNAKTPEDLEATHYAGYKIFRNARPNVPVIMTSRPGYDSNPEDSERRRQIIIASYEKAKSEGDKNVYFADGGDVYANFCRSGFTCDNCHPNDLGFYHMAKVLAPVIREVLEMAEK